jgi:hypothetical protein
MLAECRKGCDSLSFFPPRSVPHLRIPEEKEANLVFASPLMLREAAEFDQPVVNRSSVVLGADLESFVIDIAGGNSDQQRPLCPASGIDAGVERDCNLHL